MLYNLLSDGFKACICNVFPFFHILFSLLLLLQWPHLEQRGRKPSTGLHRKSNLFMPRMFPTLWNTINIQMKSLIVFFFLPCAIKPESVPHSEGTCTLPQRTWPTSSNTIRTFFPHSLTSSVWHRLSFCWAPSVGLWCCLSPQCLVWKKNPECQRNTNLCHQNMCIISKELTSLYILQNWSHISGKSVTETDLMQPRNNHGKAFWIQPSMK